VIRGGLAQRLDGIGSIGATVRAHVPRPDGSMLRNRWFADSPLEGDGFEPWVPHRAARRCSAKKRRSSHIPSISARLPLEQEPRSWVTTDARVVVEIVGCRRSLQANLDLFLVEMPGRAPPYKGERDSNATGGTRRSPRDLAPASSRRHPNGHMGPFSCFTGRRIFSTLSITVSLIRRWIDAACPGHSVDAAGSHGRRGGVGLEQRPGNTPEISEGSTV